MNEEKELETYITIAGLAKLKIVPFGETKLYEFAKKGYITTYKIPDSDKTLVLASEVYRDIKKYNKRLIYGKDLIRLQKKTI
jgi:hypothetical protein